jgi:hypothetical protein
MNKDPLSASVMLLTALEGLRLSPSVVDQALGMTDGTTKAYILSGDPTQSGSDGPYFGDSMALEVFTALVAVLESGGIDAAGKPSLPGMLLALMRKER